MIVKQRNFYQYARGTEAYTLVMNPGKIYVFVGFTDLSMLLFSDSSGGTETEPITFAGVESCAICVARTLIIKQMLLGNSNINSIF